MSHYMTDAATLSVKGKIYNVGLETKRRSFMGRKRYLLSRAMCIDAGVKDVKSIE